MPSDWQEQSTLHNYLHGLSRRTTPHSHRVLNAKLNLNRDAQYCSTVVHSVSGLVQLQQPESALQRPMLMMQSRHRKESCWMIQLKRSSLHPQVCEYDRDAEKRVPTVSQLDSAHQLSV